MIQPAEIADAVIESLALSHEEAEAYHNEQLQAGARLLCGFWYANPEKEQITADIVRQLERRPLRGRSARFVGRAVIRESDMVGIALWLPAEH